MIECTPGMIFALPPQDDLAGLRRVFDSARRFIAFRERAAALGEGSVVPAASLADAIDRDFLLFDLQRAVEDLRDAVRAMDRAPRGAANDATTPNR